VLNSFALLNNIAKYVFPVLHCPKKLKNVVLSPNFPRILYVILLPKKLHHVIKFRKRQLKDVGGSWLRKKETSVNYNGR